jgi:hypothetical protein
VSPRAPPLSLRLNHLCSHRDNHLANRLCNQ